MSRLSTVFLFRMCYGTFGEIYLLFLPFRRFCIWDFRKRNAFDLSSGDVFTISSGSDPMLDHLLSGRQISGGHSR